MDTIGRYELLEKLGQGGMGVVHRAFDTLLQRAVAVKLISAPIEEGTDLRERFFREARAAGQLAHRNIITIYDLGEHEGRPYLAMEFLEGEDLQRRLARGEVMSLTQKLDLSIELCDALDFAHAHGVIHRDIKPANIFITATGSVKILDFGLARLVTSELTNSNMMMGTLNYMAPEQVRGERADHRSDIFSVGVVMYELLSGRKAFQGDSFASTLFKILEGAPEPLLTIDSTLPADVVAIVEKTLAKSREQRHQQMTELLRELAAARQQAGYQDTPTRAYPVPSAAHRVPSDVAAAIPIGPATPRTPMPLVDPASDAPTGAPMLTPIGMPSPAATSTGSGQAPSTGSGQAPSTGSGQAPSTGSGQALRQSSRRTPMIAVIAGAAAIVAAGGFWIVYQSRAVPPASQPAPSAGVSTPVVPPAPAPAPAPAPSTAAPAATAPSVPAEPATVVDARAIERSARDARTRMSDAKIAARRTGTPATASAAFAAASAADREAERLFKTGQLAEATAKFYEASGLYRSAEIAAQSKPGVAPPPAPAQPDPIPAPSTGSGQAAPVTVLPAPPASTQPAEKPAAPPTPPPPAPAAAPPVTVPAAPSTSPGQAPQPVQQQPPAATVSPEDAIRDLLSRYKAALEARSLDVLKRLWPSLGGSQQTAIQREFEHATRIEVTLLQPQITVAGNTATVTFTRRYRLQTTDGQTPQTDTRTTMTLRQFPGGWVIDQIRFDSPR